jgi:hypothetical protein
LTTESRVVAVRLPADHPVFNLPQRSRAETIRRWLEMGMSLSLLNETIEVKSKKLDYIIELIEEIKERASNTNGEGPQAGNQETELIVNLDFDSFIDSVSEVFRDPKEGDE